MKVIIEFEVTSSCGEDTEEMIRRVSNIIDENNMWCRFLKAIFLP